MRLITTLVISVVFPAAVSAQVAQPAENGAASTPPNSEQRVSVMFSATDAKGNPILNLTNDQVFVYMNNQPAQTLDVQKASDLPLHLGIVLLASKKSFEQEQAAAIDLAQRVLRPGTDKAFVVTAGGDKPWPNPKFNWLTDGSAVVATVRGLDKNAGLPDLFSYQVDTSATALNRISIEQYNLEGGFSVFDVVWAMMKSDPAPARRAVVIFRNALAHGTGWEMRSRQASDANHNRVIATAESLGVSFFTIGVEVPSLAMGAAPDNISDVYGPPIHGGQSIGARDYDQGLNRWTEQQYTAGRHNIDRIADETGGRSWWTTKKNYSDAIAGISNELAARYVVSFAPSADPSPASAHTLKVTATRAAHISAPRAYIVPTERKPN